MLGCEMIQIDEIETKVTQYPLIELLVFDLENIASLDLSL